MTENQLHEAMDTARQPKANTAADGLQIGLCWFNWKNNKTNIVVQLHNGLSGGHRSFIGLVPEQSLAVVVLSNTVAEVESIGIEIIESLSRMD